MATAVAAKQDRLPCGGYRAEVELEGVQFRVEVERKEASEASAEWRKPAVWYVATVTALPTGVRVAGPFRVYANVKPLDVMYLARLAFWCHGCKTSVGAWHWVEALLCCTDCEVAVNARPERERIIIVGSTGPVECVVTERA